MSPSETDAALRALLRPGETWASLGARIGVSSSNLSTARTTKGASSASIEEWRRRAAGEAPQPIRRVAERWLASVRQPVDLESIRGEGETLAHFARRLGVTDAAVWLARTRGLSPTAWAEWQSRAAAKPYQRRAPTPAPTPEPPRAPRAKKPAHDRAPVVIPPYRPNPTRARAQALYREASARRLEAESGVVHPHDPGVATGVLPAWATRLLATDPTIQDPPPTPPWHGSLRSQLHRDTRAPWHAWPTP